MSRGFAVSSLTLAMLAIAACGGSHEANSGGSVSPVPPATNTSCEATVGSPGSSQQQSGYYSAPGCPDISIPPSQR
jgi:hypothetical protein